MELIKNNTTFQFMKYRFVWLAISFALIALSVVTWVQKGEDKYGVDFVGGTEMAVRFDKPVDIADVRRAVPDAGVQSFEDKPGEFSIRAKAGKGSGVNESIKASLTSTIAGNSFTVLKEDFVGPTIGAQVRKDGLLAFILSLVGILIYISVRFELSYAFGAIAALFHDAIITAGIYVLSGREVNAALLAAVLTIVGYSVNDTIIVFDRIRENVMKALKTGTARKTPGVKTSMSDIVDLSVNQTLSRTILTSLTVLFVAMTLWLFGGGALGDLAFAMFIGVIVGSYSTIFIASPIVLMAQAVTDRKRTA